MRKRRSEGELKSKTRRDNWIAFGNFYYPFARYRISRNTNKNMFFLEFSADPKKIGVRENPISKEKTKSKTFESQESRFQDNMELFNETLEYFRDCFDCYAVMCRQKSRAALDDEKCILAMQLIHRGRFNVGDILEEIRMYDKNYEDEVQCCKYDEQLNAIRKNGLKEIILPHLVCHRSERMSKSNI